MYAALLLQPQQSRKRQRYIVERRRSEVNDDHFRAADVCFGLGSTILMDTSFGSGADHGL